VVKRNFLLKKNLYQKRERPKERYFAALSKGPIVIAANIAIIKLV